MAAPNLLSASSITGKTVGASLTSTNVSDILTNSSSSGKVLKVNSAYAVNTSETTEVTVTFSFYDSSSTTSYKLAHKMAIPVGSSLVLIEKLAPIYLEEGDKLTAQSSLSSNLEFVISFEEIS